MHKILIVEDDAVIAKAIKTISGHGDVLGN